MTPDETLNRATLWNRLERNLAKMVSNSPRKDKDPPEAIEVIQDGFNIARTFFNDVGRIASALEHIAENTKDV